MYRRVFGGNRNATGFAASAGLAAGVVGVVFGATAGEVGLFAEASSV